MPRAPSIVKRFPGEYVAHITFWHPHDAKLGEYKTRYELEGRVPKALVDFVEVSAALASRITPAIEAQLVALTDEILKLPERENDG